MAMPDGVFSSQAIPTTFVGGRVGRVQKDSDFEYGGVALQDPSRGLQYQVWRSVLRNGFIYLSAPNTPEYVYLDLPNVTEFSFTFDQNANIIFTYVQNDVVKLRWWDTSLGAYTVSEFQGDKITPRITLDDKRELQRGISDVILFYVKPIRNGAGDIIDGSLCKRVQRERYLIEHVVATEVTDGIIKCGMLNNWRLGVQLKQLQPPKWVGQL